MAVLTNTTTTAQFTVKAREIDFVTRFADNWDSLREIMGIMRPVRMMPGTKLTASKASIELEDGDVAEGDEIPASLAKVEPVVFEEIDLEKYRKRVTIESVKKFGAQIAVQKTDDAFLNELQGNVLDRFYTFLATGTLTSTETTFQMAIAMAIGKVVDKFKKMRKDSSNIVVFVNTLDAYQYLGAANISVQTTNGITYLKNFMGANTVILSSEIERKKVIATPVDNIVMYYVDPSDGDYKELGLDYTVVGETPLIGMHAEGVYDHASGDIYALMGVKLFAEFIDAIAVVTVGE